MTVADGRTELPFPPAPVLARRQTLRRVHGSGEVCNAAHPPLVGRVGEQSQRSEDWETGWGVSRLYQRRFRCGTGETWIPGMSRCTRHPGMTATWDVLQPSAKVGDCRKPSHSVVLDLAAKRRVSGPRSRRFTPRGGGRTEPPFPPAQVQVRVEPEDDGRKLRLTAPPLRAAGSSKARHKAQASPARSAP